MGFVQNGYSIGSHLRYATHFGRDIGLTRLLQIPVPGKLPVGDKFVRPFHLRSMNSQVRTNAVYFFRPKNSWDSAPYLFVDLRCYLDN